jgi:hypothetical protein
MITRDDVVEWIQQNSINELVEAVYDAGAGAEQILLNELSLCANAPAIIMPANFCDMGEEEQFLVVVRSVNTTDRLGSMKLLRKMGHTLSDTKRLLTEAPFHFYCTEEYPTAKLYYDPTNRDSSNGGEYFQEAVDLGFNMLVISTFSEDIDKWMDTLTEEEHEDVVFGLDFYVKLFDEYIVIPD